MPEEIASGLSSIMLLIKRNRIKRRGGEEAVELPETLEGKLKPLGYFPLMHSCALPWCFAHLVLFAPE